MDIYDVLRVSKATGKSELQRHYSRLLDSYQLVLLSSQDESVLSLAGSKISRLKNIAKASGLDIEAENAIGATEQTELSVIKMILNSSNSNASILAGANISGRINQLPLSGEKHYLLAVVMLRLNNGLQGCNNAIPEIRQALEFDPANVAYLSLLEAIVMKVEQFEDTQKQLLEERGRQRLGAIQATRRREFFSSVFDEYGEIICICGLIIAPFACICCYYK